MAFKITIEQLSDEDCPHPGVVVFNGVSNPLYGLTIDPSRLLQYKQWNTKEPWEFDGPIANPKIDVTLTFLAQNPVAVRMDGYNQHMPGPATIPAEMLPEEVKFLDGDWAASKDL